MKIILLVLSFVSLSSVAQARMSIPVDSFSECLSTTEGGRCTWAVYCSVYINGDTNCNYFVPGNPLNP